MTTNNNSNRKTSTILAFLVAVGGTLGSIFKDTISTAIAPFFQQYIVTETKTIAPDVFQVNYLYKDKETGALKPILPDTVLQSGDQYKVIFTPNKDGYVYLFQVDSLGQCFQLFPMREFKGAKFNNVNPVIAGQRYVLPTLDKSFRLDTTVGRERIYLIVTAYPHAGLESLAQRLDAARQSKESIATELNAQLTVQVEGKDGRYKLRGFDTVETDEVIKVSWSGNDKEIFNTLGRSLRNICEDCVYGVEFEHK